MVFDSLSWNIRFVHSYARSLSDGLAADQARWQPEGHANNILFSIWHPFSAEDALVSRLAGRERIFEQGWSERLPLPKDWPPSWELEAKHIRELDLDLGELLDYGDAVCSRTLEFLSDMSDADAAEEMEIPWAKRYFPDFSVGTRVDLVAYFAITHLATHLGEVQYIKGLAGLKGTAI